MIHIRTMTLADIPLGMRLKEQSGWNQVEADWRRYIELQPDGCFVAEWNGVGVGTTTTCIFDSVAWIAMVLVEKEHRSQGIGKALMQHALNFLDARKIPTIRLDATQLGLPLYEKLGFVVEHSLGRYDGVVTGAPRFSGSSVGQAGPEQFEHLVALDRDITGTNRRKLLLRLFAEEPEALRVAQRDGRLAGFVTSRPGTLARHIGPCLAAGDAGLALLATALTAHQGSRVFVDVPLGHAAAVAFVEATGLKVQRPLVRMCRGKRVAEDVSRLWASSGPELG